MPTEKKVTKRTTTSKPKTTRARAPKKEVVENPNRVAVLQTHVGVPLILRANPSEAEIISFVNEHNRRYQSGEPGGPSGQPAYLILSGAYFESEEAYNLDPGSGTPIEL